MSEETVGVIVFGTLGTLLLALGVRTLIVRSRGLPDVVLACRRCGLQGLTPLANDGISRHPGYRCTECGLRMRPAGSTFLYAVVLTLSIALLALSTLPMWAPVEGQVIVYPFMLVVASYSVWQLLRPTPLRYRVG